MKIQSNTDPLNNKKQTKGLFFVSYPDYLKLFKLFEMREGQVNYREPYFLYGEGWFTQIDKADWMILTILLRAVRLRIPK